MRTENKEREKTWQNKAVIRSKTIKSLKKEVGRQKGRADKWRARSKSLEGQLLELQGQSCSNAVIEQELGAVSKPKRVESGKQDMSLKGYKFPLSVMWLCLNLYKAGLSLRGVVGVLIFIRGYLGLNYEIPSYGTVRLWIQKTGLYLLEKGGKLGSKIGEQWCFIVDESHSLGKSQLLVILGVRLNSLKLGEALSHHQVQPLLIQSRVTWKQEDVAEALKQAQQKVGGTISYVVSDRGGNLVGAYQQIGIPHVPDWGHYVANILEKCYAQEDDFKLFNEKMGAFKKKRKQSRFTEYTPPNLSVKIRFMNYLPFLDWANIMLTNFKDIPKEIVEELEFLQTLKPFIGEMTDLFYAGDKIGLLLKKQGISPHSRAQAKQMLQTLTQKYPDNSRVKIFCDQVSLYFETTCPIYLNMCQNNSQQNGQLPPFAKPLVASSDVIESLFGKLKHRTLKDPKRGFSPIALVLSLFCRSFSPLDVLKALSEVNSNKLNAWIRHNMPTKKYTSFRNVFKAKTKNGGTFGTRT